MTFQGAALPRGAANGNPLQPYSESGDTITPADCESAIFDAAEVPYAFPGDSTSWFGFAAGNTITPTGAYPVSLDNAMEGPSSIGSGNVDFTVTGFFDGGGMVSPTFIGLAAAATETMGFTNLDSLQFAVQAMRVLTTSNWHAPEPASLLLPVAGFAGLAAIFRRRRLACV